MWMRKRVGIWIGLALLVGLSACTATYRNHGYVPDDVVLSDVIVGVDTRASVEETVGRPVATGVREDTAWYYVGSKWEYFAYRKPRPIERQIVAISFRPSGVVSNIERFSLEDGKVVTLSRRVTDSNIKNVTFLRQLLGSVGNFNPADFFN